MLLLLLEGDAHLQSYLKKSLTSEGYQVSTYSSKSDLKVLLLQKDFAVPSVIILDQKLSDGESFDLIPSMKLKWPDTPIMVICDFNIPRSKSLVLDQGADDCMVKPLSLEELAARLRVLRRRASPKSSKSVVLGNTKIDYDQQLAYANGQKVHLCRKEFQLLQLLMEHPTKVYSKFQILDQVWDVHTDVESNVVEVTVKNLRKKLEQAHSSLQIDSRRNVGYYLETSPIS